MSERHLPPPGTLARLAQRAVSEVAAECGGEPSREFVLWLKIAMRRETGAATMYSRTTLRPYLALLKRREWPTMLLDKVRRSLDLVRSQESGHAAYFEQMWSALSDSCLFAKTCDRICSKIAGKVEGWMMSQLASPSASIRRALSQWSMRLAAVMGFAPDTGRWQTQETVSGYCRISAELEQSAIVAYRRIAELALTLRQQIEPSKTIRFGDIGLMSDLEHIRYQEKYHYLLFRRFSHWLARLDRLNAPPDPAQAEQLYDRIQVAALRIAKREGLTLRWLASETDVLALRGPDIQFLRAIAEMTNGSHAHPGDEVQGV